MSTEYKIIKDQDGNVLKPWRPNKPEPPESLISRNIKYPIEDIPITNTPPAYRYGDGDQYNLKEIVDTVTNLNIKLEDVFIYTEGYHFENDYETSIFCRYEKSNTKNENYEKELIDFNNKMKNYYKELKNYKIQMSAYYDDLKNKLENNIDKELENEL